MKDNNIVHLGKILKESREQQNITLEKMALKTRIKMEHLINLEDEHFEKLPPKIFIKGIISKYCDICGLDKKEMLKQFDNYLIEDKAEKKKNRYNHKNNQFQFHYNLYKIISVCFIALAAIFIGIHMFLLIAPPSIIIFSPPKDLHVNRPYIEIVGKVSRAKLLFINQKSVNYRKDGEFSYTLALEEGINNIEITAQNNAGKITTVIRKVIYQR